MSWASVVVVMPAFNESEGLAGFVQEIDTHLRPHVGSLRFVVVDDASTEPMGETLVWLSSQMGGRLEVVVNESNMGHGPSALRAYKAGLAHAPDVIIHVDGDGQFQGSDFPRLLIALSKADVVHGVRCSRSDPWYRKILSAGVRLIVFTSAGSVPDVNTPLRAYRADRLEKLVARIPESSKIPHVHFSILERRLHMRVDYVKVESLPRRGGSSTGTSWQESKSIVPLPPRKLIRFCLEAVSELVSTDYRQSLPPVPLTQT